MSAVEKEIEEDMMLELKINHIRGRKDFHSREDLQDLLKIYQDRQKEIENNKKLAMIAQEYSKRLMKTKLLWEKIAPVAKWEPLPLDLFVENKDAMIAWLWFSQEHKPVFEGPNQCKGRNGSANRGVSSGLLPGRVSIDSEWGDSRNLHVEKSQQVFQRT